jgi:hypothetical protein
MGISYLLHSHFPSSTSSSSSSSSSSCSSSQPLSFHVKNSNNNEMTGRRRVVSACMGQEDPKDIVFSKKRAVLFLGISVLPFLQLRARALEGLVTSEFNFLVFGIRDMEFCSSFFFKIVVHGQMGFLFLSHVFN